MPNRVKLCVLAILILSLSAFAKYDPNNFTPDNAAYWYQKAFDLYEEPNDIDLSSLIRGEIELTPSIEQYLKSQQPVIELIEKATEIEHCDWECDHYLYVLKVHGAKAYDYLQQLRKLSYLLSATIEADLSKDQFDKAILHAGLILNIARDSDGNTAMPFFVCSHLRKDGYWNINKIINALPKDSRNLKATKILLIKEANHPYSTYDDMLSYLIKWTEKYCNKSYFQDGNADNIFFVTFELCKEFDDDFFERNARFCIDRLQQIKQLCKLPYPRRIETIDKLRNDLDQKFDQYTTERLDHLPIKDFTREDYEYLEKLDYWFAAFVTPLTRELEMEIRSQSHLNALRCAVVLRQIYDKTNKLPETIPLSCPKDVYSNKPFLILKTKDGFELKLPRENLLRNEKSEYEFKLPKD